MVRHSLPRSDRSSIIIDLATKADMPAIADVHEAAFAGNLINTLLRRSRPANWREEFIKDLEKVMEDPQKWLLVARDAETRKILGIGFWAVPVEGESIMSDGEAQGTLNWSAGVSLGLSGVMGTRGDDRESLRDALMAGLMGMQDNWIKGKHVLLLGLLAVHPDFQGRGIGSMLLQAGMDRGDETGTVCFLLATPAGYPVYLHCGWKPVENFDLNLLDWAGANSGYGIYRHAAMLRLPNKR